MKLFASRKIKFSSVGILWFILALTLTLALSAGFEVRNALYCILLSNLCMGAVILMFCFRYSREQHTTTENAISQMKESISGNKGVTVECNDEGELYRLFCEVNSLVSILNTHTVNETSSKKFLQDTISGVSYQLKTPLTALNICNGIIQDEGKNSPVIQGLSLLSEQELDRIEILVQNFLKIAKLGTGMTILEKSLGHVPELAENIKQHFLFRAQRERKEICLSGGREITLLCDRTWIIEAVSSLVKNAFDHTEKGSFVHTEWQAFASAVQTAIKDNGYGIHPEDLYHIFERLYWSRFPKDTQGIGLGLSLAKVIAEAHNGAIGADSTLGIGISTAINFLIPSKF